MTLKRVLPGLLIGLLLLAGCKQQVDVSQPPKILFGQDLCDQCNMIISEEAMAAAYWTAGGEARRFDDIGGMLRYQQEHGEAVASWWVHDLSSSAWIRAADATFVIGSGVSTPMGYGIVAFADKGAAQALARGEAHAMALTFDELQIHVAGATMPTMHSH